MKAVELLSKAIRFRTVSYSDYTSFDYGEFTGFLDFLEESFPLVFDTVQKTRVEDYNLLLKLPGRDGSLKPYLFIAHYDVVPASDEGWPYPAFSGAVEEGRIWGRGSLDDKSSLIALLFALEKLLEEGFEANRDLYFAFGHDEEVGGIRGALKIAEYLEKSGIFFEGILDEGGAVSPGDVLGIDDDVAVVGFAEKGNSSLKFTFTGDEGHSSTPAKQTSISKMAAFIGDVEKNPRPPKLLPTVESMLKNIADYKSGIERMVLRDPSRYFFFLKKILDRNRQTSSMIRTTVAFTMCEAGTSHNVLPRTASCVANVRLLPGDSFQEIVQWFDSLGHDYSMEILTQQDGTRASSEKSEFYRSLKDSINKFFPGAMVTPYLVSGGTDSKHYDKLVDNSFRFLPVRLTSEDLSKMHGRGEFISLENYRLMIDFYKDFLSKEAQDV